MNIKHILIGFLSLSLLPTALTAANKKAKQIHFEKGTTQQVVSGNITGHQSILYKINAQDKQWLKVEMLPKGGGADFSIYVPGQKIGGESLFNSLVGDQKYIGQLYKSGDHVIEIFLNRASARRGKTYHYNLLVSITDTKPGAEEVPSTGPVPQRVINDCITALKKQIPDRKMTIMRAERGENSFIIDVKVKGVPKLWRCYHDGTKCTGTEYQGEG